ncbi:MAG: rhodanese-like domain-containing protein, partial [Thermoanaerobaculia bacterium]|nr:rhodanese-like domain-containing protein [Thermoanaerobaculia bacterium]
VVLVTEDAAGAAEAATRLARVGLENVAGFLDGGVAAWDRAGFPVARLEQIDISELKARRDDDPGLTVLDVRRPVEYAAGHVPGALSFPLDRLAREIDAVPAGGRVAIVCASGYRSSIAGSLLLGRKGVEPINVIGGTSAWVAAGYPTERPAA